MMKGKLLVTIIQSSRFVSHCASESVQTKSFLKFLCLLNDKLCTFFSFYFVE